MLAGQSGGRARTRTWTKRCALMSVSTRERVQIVYKIVYIFVYLGATAPGVYDVPIVRGGGRVNLVNGKRAVPVQEIQEGFQEAWQYQAVFDVPGTIDTVGKSQQCKPRQTECRKMGILAPETVQLPPRA